MNTTELVEHILKNSEAARNSDHELIIAFLEARGANLDAHTKELLKVTNMESIRRVRCKLQEKGLYPASDFVAKERRHKSAVIQQTIKGSSPQQVARAIESPTPIPWGLE